MNKTQNPIQDFITKQSNQLFTLIKRNKLMTDEQADSLIHALVDIAESIEKVYLEILPEIIKNKDASPDVLKDHIWDIREEFRHIDYHIHDGKLTEL